MDKQLKTLDRELDLVSNEILRGWFVAPRGVAFSTYLENHRLHLRLKYLETKHYEMSRG